MQEILRMEHITKRFGNMYANRDINFEVRRGEVHTLLGENGAGKSTLMNVLFGLYQPTEGSIYLNGSKVRIDSPAQAVKLGVGMVHQHFMLVEAMTVFENIILGDRNTKGVFIDRDARRREILALSEQYGLDVELDKPITEIAVGAQQRVEILKALYKGAELLVLDEPTAALTDIEVEGLFQIIKKLTSEGKSVIFMSHKMREVLHISDRITILRAGESVCTLNREETTGEELANLMIGRELVPSQYNKIDDIGDAVIRLSNVDYCKESKHNGLNGVSLSVGRGEIVGIAGVDGNGQSQLAQVVTGVVAFIGGMELDTTKGKYEGFKEAAAYTAEQAGKTASTLDIVYSNSFSASDKGIEFAKAMIDQGADVFFGDASAVDSGARQAIDEYNASKGEVVVYDIAQPGDLLGQNECIICSQVTDNSSLVALSMESVENGVLGGDVIYGTMENGALYAGAISDLVPAEIQEQYLAYVDQMIAGTFMQ